MQGCIFLNPGGWVASIDFGKTVGPIFKIWPVDKVIQEIKFGQELHMPVYYRHFGFLLYSKSINKIIDFLQQNWKIFFLVNLFTQYFSSYFFYEF